MVCRSVKLTDKCHPYRYGVVIKHDPYHGVANVSIRIRSGDTVIEKTMFDHPTEYIETID